MEGIGTWTTEGTKGQAEFIGNEASPHTVPGNLWKFFEGGSKAKYIDPLNKFVLLDAQDEVIRADASTGNLKTVATLSRHKDQGLRHSRFISSPVPVFIFELGLVVFDSHGQFQWSCNDLKLDHHFQEIKDGKILYSSEHRGKWVYDISTGQRETVA
jgi:hypothetical protein